MKVGAIQLDLSDRPQPHTGLIRAICDDGNRRTHRIPLEHAQEADMITSRDQFVFFFRGPLSQWHPSEFRIEGKTFVCAEQFMMYCKAEIFADHETARKILAARSAADQKSLGRQVTGFKEGTWRLFREGVVFTANLAKFTQNADLGETLLSTKDRVIVEASPKDTVWGVGLGEDDPRILDPSQWRGTNLLGKALMQVRSCLRDGLPAFGSSSF